MSDEGRAFVKDHSPFSGTTFWVHYVMGDLANKQNHYEIWIGDKRLAEEWPISVRAIQRARADLVEAGYLTLLDDKSGPGRPIRYRFEFGNTRQVGGRSEVNTRQVGEQHPPGMSEHPPKSETTPITNQRTKVEPKSLVVANADDLTVQRLCTQLAKAVANFQEGPEPPVTAKWKKDMRLLIQRGPLQQAKPTPMSAVHIEATINVVFTVLAEPSSSGFCWAAQIRSPHALRDHWHQMAVAYKTTKRGKAPKSDHYDVLADLLANGD